MVVETRRLRQGTQCLSVWRRVAVLNGFKAEACWYTATLNAAELRALFQHAAQRVQKTIRCRGSAMPAGYDRMNRLGVLMVQTRPIELQGVGTPAATQQSRDRI